MAKVSLTLILNDEDLKKSKQTAIDVAKRYIQHKNYGGMLLSDVRLQFEEESLEEIK